MHATCQKCGHVVSVPSEFAERRLKCPKCMAMIVRGESDPSDNGLRLPIVMLLGLTRLAKKAPAMLSIQPDQLVITGGNMDEPVIVGMRDAKKRVTIMWQVAGWAMVIKTWSGMVTFLLDGEVAKLARGWYFLACDRERAGEWDRASASLLFRLTMSKPIQLIAALGCIALGIEMFVEFGVGAGIGVLALSVALGLLAWRKTQSREGLKKELLQRLGQK